MDVGNLFDELPEEPGGERRDGTGERFADELVERLVDDGVVRIERIVSRGHASPPGFWYDQQEDEWVALLCGAAGLEFEGETREVTMRPGDHVLIPARKRHRVAWTAPSERTVWLAVFTRRRSGGDEA